MSAVSKIWYVNKNPIMPIDKLKAEVKNKFKKKRNKQQKCECTIQYTSLCYTTVRPHSKPKQMMKLLQTKLLVDKSIQ